MALPISMFTKGVLITTPPLIYIFVGDVPMNSLVGDVGSVSQESDMRSDDPNALPQGDSINSDVLPPTPVNPLDNKALPSSDPVVDDGNAKESEPGVPAAEPVVDNSVDVKETNPKVSEEGPKEDGHSSVDKKEDTDDDEPKGDGDPSTDDLATGEEDTDDEDDQEPTPDTSRNSEFNEKLKKAGIDSSCYLPNLQTVGKCELDKDQMLKINFPQREIDEEDNDLEITGLNDGEKVILTIESGYDEEDDFPKDGLRLTFRNPNSKQVKITGSAADETNLEPNIDYDFKFSLATDNWIDRAWKSLQKIGAKVGLNINDSSDDECTPGKEIQEKINVWKSKKEYVIGGLAASGSECLMKHESDVENLLEGFKLTVKDGKDISLSGGEGPSKGTIINTLKKDAFYSFAPKSIKGQKVWFLIENS